VVALATHLLAHWLVKPARQLPHLILPCRRTPEPGTYTIASHIYPGCKAKVVVRPAPQSPTAQHLLPSALQKQNNNNGNGITHSPTNGITITGTKGSMIQVDESISFPLRTSRGSQTDPISSSSRFTATSAADSHLPPLARAFQPASTPASLLPDITSRAAAAVTGGLFASPEEEELGGGGWFGHTGLRRRSSSASSQQQQQRPGSAGSAGSLGAQSLAPRGGTPDITSSLGGRATPGAESLSAAGSGASSQVSNVGLLVFLCVATWLAWSDKL
jgi:hypothetical protein